MSQFQYTIERIDGEVNVMADILTRWYAGNRVFQNKSIRRLATTDGTTTYLALVQSPFDVDFQWPVLSSIMEAERKENAPSKSEKRNGGLF